MTEQRSLVKTPMRIRPGWGGMFVAEVLPPAMPHVLLPRPLPAQVVYLSSQERLRDAIAHDLTDRAVKGRPEREALRVRNELEAGRSPQPPGWGDRTYQSVTGLRWRCCLNLFEDGHDFWCPAGHFDDPLPL